MADLITCNYFHSCNAVFISKLVLLLWSINKFFRLVSVPLMAIVSTFLYSSTVKEVTQICSTVKKYFLKA